MMMTTKPEAIHGNGQEEEEEEEDRTEPEELLADISPAESMGISELAKPLRTGAIALLDAHWIIQLATKCRKQQQQVGDGDSSGVKELIRIPRRQDLPQPEAFVSYEQLVESTLPTYQSLPIICLSYMWLDPSHPDPEGLTLQLLGRLLEVLIEPNATWGVFWDYASLFQHPDPANGKLRTSEETYMFRQGLEALPSLYGHEHTRVLKITQYPESAFHPLSLSSNDAAQGNSVVRLPHNSAPYDSRGWPFVESCWAGLTKNSENVLDLGAWDPSAAAASHHHSGTEQASQEALELVALLNQLREGTRRAPLVPERFDKLLDTKSFSNGKEDGPLVKRLYCQSFDNHFRSVETLVYARLAWTDQDIIRFAEVLSCGVALKLSKLNLSGNNFGVQGCQRIRDSILGQTNSGESIAAPPVRTLDVGHNRTLRDEGATVLAELCKHHVSDLTLCDVGLTSQGCPGFANVLTSTKEPICLCHLDLSHNPHIGNDGARSLLPLLWKTPNVRFFDVGLTEEGYELLLPPPDTEGVRWTDVVLDKIFVSETKLLVRLVLGSSSLDGVNFLDCCELRERMFDELKKMRKKSRPCVCLVVSAVVASVSLFIVRKR